MPSFHRDSSLSQWTASDFGNRVCSPPKIGSIRKNRTQRRDLKGLRGWRQRQEGQGCASSAREKLGIGPSVVVSKFATLRYRSPSELRNQNDTRNQYVASVLSIPKFAKRRYRDVANFGIGTLAHVIF